jgi:hypothetical protein
MHSIICEFTVDDVVVYVLLFYLDLYDFWGFQQYRINLIISSKMGVSTFSQQDNQATYIWELLHREMHFENLIIDLPNNLVSLFDLVEKYWYIQMQRIWKKSLLSGMVLSCMTYGEYWLACIVVLSSTVWKLNIHNFIQTGILICGGYFFFLNV